MSTIKTYPELIAALSTAGVKPYLKSHDRIRFDPPGIIPQDLFAVATEHKPELLKALHEGGCLLGCEENEQVTFDGWTHVYCDWCGKLLSPPRPPEGWTLPEPEREVSTSVYCGTQHLAPRRRATKDRCSCGSTEFVDVEIHRTEPPERRSIRRDCRRCGVFVVFLSWKGGNNSE